MRLYPPTIPKATRPLPPLPRGTIALGETSRHARAAKLALTRALGPDATNVPGHTFGRRARADTVAFQGLARLEVDGIVGPATWSRLGDWLGDDARRYVDPTEPLGPRERVVAQALWWVRNAPLIRYQQRRPMDPLRVVPRVGDCSESATLCYKWAGLPDPNGNGYNGAGYTGTLIGNGRRIAISAARPADLIFYGRMGWPTHVAVYLGDGQIMSFGATPPRLWSTPYYRSDAMYAHDYIGG